MKSSIALCTYNGEKFLGDQLQSYLDQEKLPDELVVCDDCSNDKTIEILFSFKKNAPFPVNIYINTNTLGSTKNFEKAISICSNEIIFLSDQDDLWMPEKIKVMLDQFCRNSDLGIIFSDAELVDERLKSYNKSFFDLVYLKTDKQKVEAGNISDLLLRKNIACGATMAFRRDMLSYFKPIPNDIYMIHDWWIAFVLTSLTNYIILPNRLIKYRQHRNQQIGTIREKIIKSSKKVDILSEAIAFYMKRISEIASIEIFLNTLEKKFNQYTSRIKMLQGKVLEYKNQLFNERIHFEVRNEIVTRQGNRIFPVLCEFVTGRYFKYSRGLLSALKDLFKGHI